MDANKIQSCKRWGLEAADHLKSGTNNTLNSLYIGVCDLFGKENCVRQFSFVPNQFGVLCQKIERREKEWEWKQCTAKQNTPICCVMSDCSEPFC